MEKIDYILEIFLSGNGIHDIRQIYILIEHDKDGEHI